MSLYNPPQGHNHIVQPVQAAPRMAFNAVNTMAVNGNAGMAPALGYHQNCVNNLPASTAVVNNCANANRSTTNTNVSNNSSVPTTDQTLEVHVISNCLKPERSSDRTDRLNEELIEAFHQLEPRDGNLLTLLEAFTFRFRPRQRNTEPLVMPNAKLYVQALSTQRSPLMKRIDQIVGFRCCGCRHTVLSAKLYKAGATQLVNADAGTVSIAEAIMQMRMHVVNCTFVPFHVKAAVHGESDRPKLYRFVQIWHQSYLIYCCTHDFPKLPKEYFSTLPTAVRERLIHYSRNQGQSNGIVNPSQYELGTQYNPLLAAMLHRQQQRNMQQLTPFSRAAPGTVSPPLPPVVDVEEVMQDELDNCISKALVSNNFGLVSRKPRLIASNLTELPSAPEVIPSPFVELLLSSFAVLHQRAPSFPTAETKKVEISGESHQDKDASCMTSNENDSRVANSKTEGAFSVLLQCRYCHSDVTNFCLTTGCPESTAKYINRTGGQHLCDECDKIPTSLRTKLGIMRPPNKSIEDDNNHRVVEKHFEVWRSWHRKTYDAEKTTSPTVENVELWRQLTWDIIKQEGGACLRYAKLESAKSVEVPATARKLMLPASKNDVLVGWHGAHVGNRRYRDLLLQAQPLCEEATNAQIRLLAITVAQKIISRGGNFYEISSRNAVPEPLTMEKIIKVTCRALSQGFGTVIQPLLPPVMQCPKGARVLEYEFAPQVGIFRGQVEWDRPIKKLKLDEEVEVLEQQRPEGVY